MLGQISVHSLLPWLLELCLQVHQSQDQTDSICEMQSLIFCENIVHIFL